MLNKKAGYAPDRTFYKVDPNATIHAGQVAYLTTSGNDVVATTYGVGLLPIGTFWKDHATSYIRTTVETQTFNSSDEFTLLKGNVVSTSTIKITDTAGTPYAYGTDYSVTTTNGLVVRMTSSSGGSIPALATVIVWYEYALLSTQVYWDNVSTQYTAVGQNYDRQPDDTLGSGKITVVEGNASLYTDMYDVTLTYTLNHLLYANSSSMWSITQSGLPCGRVIKVPTASDPFLGVRQIIILN